MIFALLCLISALGTSCETVKVYVEESPTPLPTKLEQPVPDQDPYVNEYRWLIREIRWELMYAKIQMLTRNITPDEFDAEQERLLKKEAAYKAAMDKYLEFVEE